jgi:hypothetical protein
MAPKYPGLMPLLTVMAAALPLAWLWGFTVDDALISARVAAELARSGRYRFNPDGPLVDAATPLGWPLLLAPFAGAGPLAALAAGKWIGAAAWLLATAALGCRLTALTSVFGRAVPLAVVATSAPIAAWAASGMETGLVTAVATLAVCSTGVPAALFAGLAAALRPELIPWAVLAAAAGSADRSLLAALRALPLALAFPLAVALVRAIVFGRAAPLSAMAKPSDLEHGFWYACEAVLYTGAPLLLLAPRTWRRLSTRLRLLLAASAAHVVAVMLAGGDWMSLYRLFVPALPGMILVGAALSDASPRASAAWVRGGLALAGAVAVAFKLGPVARDVGRHKLQLIATARPWLRPAQRVATLDVGWVGAATAATLVDLAGVTDPAIAMLRGGHTSKLIDPDLLERRGVDHLVLLLAPGAPVAQPWFESHFARVVEQRLAGQAADLDFAPAVTLPLGGTQQHYVVLRRRTQLAD